MVVLGYIANDAKHFHIYVANRVQKIRDNTAVEQWRHIATDNNPADLTSRGANARELIDSQLWWKGPAFLSTLKPLSPCKIDNLGEGDPEIKKMTTLATGAVIEADIGLLPRLQRFSSWYKAKRAVAVCLKFKERLLNRTARFSTYKPVTAEEIAQAEMLILKTVQAEAYSEEMPILRGIKAVDDNADQKGSTNRDSCRRRDLVLKKSSSLYRLDPYLDENDIIRVGGRIRRANVPRGVKHPVLLPKDSHITRVIVRHFHERTGHGGRNMTLNEVRAQGYWITSARSSITSCLSKCVICRKLRGPPLGQKMADLPEDRMKEAPPFTYAAVDYFGPFLVRQGRSDPKRYGVLFTCLSSRAIHIETANSPSTDSFLNAYRRFVCRRGPVRLLRSDQGTNFVGAKSELAAALAEMDEDGVRRRLLLDGCDWIKFEMNVPHSSHMGGVWERMIRSARNALSALLVTHGDRLDDEMLRTLMVEAEAIVNSRPLTCVDTNSPDTPEPLSPSQLLTIETRVIMPLPGNFQRNDIYCRRQWRRVQYLANEFWSRWRKEFLPTLQERRKWTKSWPSLAIGVIVLVIDDGVARCNWPMGRVLETFPGKDGLVRKARIQAGQSVLDRPVHKLILLLKPATPSVVEDNTDNWD
ncbi:uncharacterized protein LOC135494836 [Lineus longissimus]|uniref:uncharacterized protein LOC135494836 n=1 Tax=Lineus longissimus TaxID=88925 RepID=UPI00315D5AE4